MQAMNCDATNIVENDAPALVVEHTKMLRCDPKFDQVQSDARDNCIRMMTSQVCHQKVVAEMTIKLLEKGLADVHTLVDEDGNEYKAIFVAVSSSFGIAFFAIN